MTTPDDMLKLLTDLADKVASLKAIVDKSNDVVAGLKLKVAALQLAAIPEADFSPELAQIEEIESVIASITAPPVAAPPAADPVETPVVVPVAPVVPAPVVAPVEAVVPPVVVPDPVVPPVVPPVV